MLTDYEIKTAEAFKSLSSFLLEPDKQYFLKKAEDIMSQIGHKEISNTLGKIHESISDMQKS